MQLTKDKSDLIKTLNFIMTCFMIFYHTGSPEGLQAFNAVDAAVNDFLSHFFNFMCSIVMGYFFSMTGFLLFKGLSLSTYKTKIIKRVSSLFIPYLLWQIIVYVKLLIQGSVQFDIIKFLRLTFCFEMFPYDGALWYVYAVFVMAILSPILLLLLWNKKTGLISIVVLFILVCLRGKATNPYIVNVITWGYIGNIINYFIAYLIGAFYGRFYDEIKQENSLLYILILLFVAVVLEGQWSYIVAASLTSILPFMLWMQLPAIPFLKDLKIYNLTFLMYATHQPIITDIVYRLFGLFSRTSIPVSLINIITRLIVLTSVLIFCAFLYAVLNKICPKLLKLLCGGRS